MKLREGACASFIGDEGGGIASGERCVVLADEGNYSHVKWITGVRSGQYDRVFNHLLAPDRKIKVSAFDDDEFAFEGGAPSIVRVACGAVHASGGDAALLRALDSDGVLDSPRMLARQAVFQMQEALLRDPAWQEVVLELGDQGRGFLAHTVRDLMMTAAIEGATDEPD